MQALVGLLFLMQAAATPLDTPAQPAPADQTNVVQASTPAAAPDAAAQSDRVCVRERVTGSNITRRICRSRAEAEALAEETGEDMRRSGPSIGDDPANRPPFVRPR